MPAPASGVSEVPIDAPMVLEYFSEKGLSASAIQTWYAEGADAFYHKYVFRISDPKTINTEISADVGTAFHEVAQRIYEPFVGRCLCRENLLEAQAALPKVLREVVDASPLMSRPGGEAALYIRLIDHWIKALIDYDFKRLAEDKELLIVSLEQTYETRIEVEGISVKFKGNFDRLEALDDRHLICDYKTGKGFSTKSIEDIGVLFKDPNENIRRQLLLYRWLHSKQEAFDRVEGIPSVFSVQALNDGFKALQIPDNDLANTEDALKDFVSEVFEWANG
jgi:hypothetical protein